MKRTPVKRRKTTQVARSDSLVQVSELVWSEVGASIVSTPAVLELYCRVRLCKVPQGLTF